MAIDTQEKRMEATGVGRPYQRAKLPGTNDQEWRVASGNAYGGNTIAAAATAEIISLEGTTVSFPRLTNVVVDYL